MGGSVSVLPFFAAIICAAGTSSRMGGIKKEYRRLPESRSGSQGSDAGRTVLGAAVSAFAETERIGLIVIAVPPGTENGEEAARAALPACLLDNRTAANALTGRQILFVAGGKNRRASVYNALSALSAYNPGYVLIHDGARPWVRPDLINGIIDAVLVHKAVIPVVPFTETPKELVVSTEKAQRIGKPNEVGFINRHLRRSLVVAAQTPQGFAFPEILQAHEKAAEKEQTEKEQNADFEFTDDAEIWGEFVGPVAVIPGSPENRKITFPEDLV
jgi:2-C-methyl-D-erythritol 4-phosphate cytidylyltransferase